MLQVISSQLQRSIIYEASKSKVREYKRFVGHEDTTMGSPLTFCCCSRFLFMMRFTSLYLLPFVFGQGVFGQGNSAIKGKTAINWSAIKGNTAVTANSAIGQEKGNDSFLKNEGLNGSLNTRRSAETINSKDKRLVGEVPEDSFAAIYDPVVDAVCLTDPVYSPKVSKPRALYDDYVKIFDFGFKVS
jgi:hypothetical protein